MTHGTHRRAKPPTGGTASRAHNHELTAHSLPEPSDDNPAAWAESYASLGWPVIPLHTPTDDGCSCADHACGSPGKHPRTRHGLKDASTDIDRVRTWWGRWPDANIGLVTGVAFDVLDLDSDEAIEALEALEALEAEHPNTPGGPPIIATTGRGVHLYYAPTGLGNRTGILPGIDWRGVGGYVVAPPSLHASGEFYDWGDRWPADDPVSLSEVPGWLRDLIAPPTPLRASVGHVASYRRGKKSRKLGRGYGAAALASEVEAVRSAAEGSRNDTLNRAAMNLGQLVGPGVLDLPTIWNALNEAGIASGLDPREVARTLESGMTAGIAQPREVKR